MKARVTDYAQERRETGISRREQAWMVVALVATVLGFTAGMLAYVFDPTTMVLIAVASFAVAAVFCLVGLARHERRARRRRTS